MFNLAPTFYVPPQPAFTHSISAFDDILLSKKRDLVRECLNEFPNDIKWLTTEDQDIETTNDGKKSADDVAEAHFRTYTNLAGFSRPKVFEEFERTMCSFYLSGLLINGSLESYKEFVGEQKNPISWEDFQSIHALYLNLLVQLDIPEPALTQIIKSEIIFGDMGKCNNLRKMVQDFVKYNEVSKNLIHQNVPVDPDDWKKYLVNLGDLVLKQVFDAYKNLNTIEKDIFINSIQREIHIGHALHGENGWAVYQQLEALRTMLQNSSGNTALQSWYKGLFYLFTFTHICDVAGAAGQKNPDYSLVYTKTVHDNIFNFIKNCELFFENKIETMRDLYYKNFSDRCETLGLNDIISPINEDSSSRDKLFGLLVCHYRISEYKKAVELYEIIKNCNESQVEEMWQFYGIDGNTYNTYLPILFCACKDLNDLPFIIQIVNCLPQLYSKAGVSKTNPLNVNKIATKEAVEFLLKEMKQGQKIENLLEVKSNGKVVFK